MIWRLFGTLYSFMKDCSYANKRCTGKEASMQRHFFFQLCFRAGISLFAEHVEAESVGYTITEYGALSSYDRKVSPISIRFYVRLSANGTWKWKRKMREILNFGGNFNSQCKLAVVIELILKLCRRKWSLLQHWKFSLYFICTYSLHLHKHGFGTQIQHEYRHKGATNS